MWFDTFVLKSELPATRQLTTVSRRLSTGTVANWRLRGDNHRVHLVRSILAWVALGVSLAMAGTAIALDAGSGSNPSGLFESVAFAVASLSTTGVGFLLSVKQEKNPIGWILLASGLYLALLGLTSSYANYGVLEHPGTLPATEWAVMFRDRTWPALFVGLTAVAYLFPTGSLPAGRWRPIAWITACSFLVALLVTPFTAEAFADPFAGVENPLPEINPDDYSFLLWIAMVGALAGMAGAVLSVRSRLKAARGTELLQLRWVAFSATFIPAVVVVCLTEVAITGEDGPATFIAAMFVIALVPASIAVAVLRYRLYDIDRLANRSLVYACLTAILTVTFGAVTLLVGTWAGSGSTLPTAAATLAVALAFGPLRSSIQRLVDRRFNPEKYRGLKRVQEFLEDLRAGRAAPEDTALILAEALEDPTLELFLWLGDEGKYVDTAGAELADAARKGRAEVPIRRGNLNLAVVVHDPSLQQRQDLLRSVIAASSLAIEIARLRVEVNLRLAEVKQSRSRMVAAGIDERRRLERDLHDGAQQRLVSLGLSLRHLQSSFPTSEAEVRDHLDESVLEVGGVIEELRELARGVRPAALDGGLGPALRELAARSPLDVELMTTSERFDERIETAAYFAVSESLTNCVKHSGASLATVEAARRNGSLQLSVSDHGSGGAKAAPGSGLAGLEDRIEALGGSLKVLSPTGDGTKVLVELPCAW